MLWVVIVLWSYKLVNPKRVPFNVHLHVKICKLKLLASVMFSLLKFAQVENFPLLYNLNLRSSSSTAILNSDYKLKIQSVIWVDLFCFCCPMNFVVFGCSMKSSKFVLVVFFSRFSPVFPRVITPVFYHCLPHRLNMKRKVILLSFLGHISTKS